jgi:hypothetical protein
MSRRVLALILLVVAASRVRADVSPYPAWRLATDGAVSAVVQAGDVVFVAGTFTKVGVGVAPFDAALDPQTLAVTAVEGCARDGGGPLAPRTLPGGYYPYALSSPVSDGNGPFVLEPSTDVVRVGPDCRFDRAFRVVLPGLTIVSALVDRGPSVFASVSYRPTDAAVAIPLVVELDRGTGAVRQYWQTPQHVHLLGVSPQGRLVAKSGSSSEQVIGWFDPAQGVVVAGQRFTTTNGVAVDLLGRVVIANVVGALGHFPSQYYAYDADTLAPLPQWPDVQLPTGTAARVYAAGDGRVFIMQQGLVVDDIPAPVLSAYDAVTGAQVAGWQPPSWLAGTTASRLHVAGGRLLVLGHFAADAPRDSLVALDATTGALDPWEMPFATTVAAPIGARLFLGTITSGARVARDRLAALEAGTGVLLPWAASPLPSRVRGDTVFGAVGALADDGQYLYVAWEGGVRRYGLTDGAADPSWRLDLERAPGFQARASAMVVADGEVHVVGTIAQARGGDSAPWEPREGGAAISTAGVLTAWRPRIEGVCRVSERLPSLYPCIQQLARVGDVVYLQGELQRLDEPAGRRHSLVAVSADTGGILPDRLPFVPVGVASAVAAAGDVVFAAAQVGQAGYLYRLDPSGLSLVAGALSPAESWAVAVPYLAAHASRLYADVERDDASGRPTGNPVAWARPVAAPDGVLDIELTAAPSAVAWYPDIPSTAPGTPTGLTVALTGRLVTLGWTRAAEDLQPLEQPAAVGGPAATSHVVVATLAPGGPAVAMLDTGSPATMFEVMAPDGVFFVRVHARNQFGASGPSNEVRVEVRRGAPLPPLATTATVAGSTVQIAWAPALAGWAPTGFVLEAGRTAGASDIGGVAVTGPSMVVPGVPPGRYYVRVRAVNAQGASAPGGEVTIDVP